MDAEHYLKMKAKEDPELERKVGEWIEDITGVTLEDTGDLWKSLKSGIVLCILANKITPGVVQKYNTPKVPGKPLHPLMERENLNLYLDACWRLGMSRDALFIASDLHDRKGMSSVIANLVALSQKAALIKQFNGVAPIGPAQRSTNKPNPTKWELPEQKNVNVADLAADESPEFRLKETTNKLREAMRKVEALESANESKKRDIDSLRQQLRDLKQGTSSSPVVTARSAAQRQNIDALLDESNEKIARLERSVAEARMKENSAVDKVALLEKEVRAREMKVNQLHATIRELRAELEKAKSELRARASSFSSSSPPPPVPPKGDAVKKCSTQPTTLKPTKPVPPTKSKMQRQEAKRDVRPKSVNKKKSQLVLDKEIVTVDDANEEIERLRDLLSQSLARELNLQKKLGLIQKPLDVRAIQTGVLVDSVYRSDQEHYGRLRTATRGVPPVANNFYSSAQKGSTGNATTPTDDMERLRKEVEKIFSPEQTLADESVILSLKHVFSDDMGRRFFTYLIEAELGFDPKTVVELSDDNFELLLFMITTCMECLDLSNGADYISAKRILQTASRILRHPPSKKEKVRETKFGSHVMSVQEAVGCHVMWQNLNFWIEFFLDSIASKYGQKIQTFLNDTGNKKSAAFLRNELKKFPRVMLVKGGGLKVEHAMYAVDTLALQLDLKFSLTSEEMAELQAHVVKIEKKK
eukprot:TRINITY_DN5196_c0_g1_i3.p1 TRINITY_DN5196_c0_g1~~TRINITY_DN5196_c0_g1_i3.p1  ORF type:complete len:723 (-),score=170.73 TRINITY_DN5196_c0_g1_i3:52-2148(-)